MELYRPKREASREATRLHEASRERVRTFINAASTNEIIFTRGTTEAINLLASSFGEAFLREGDEVVYAHQINEDGEIIIATDEGRFKRVIVSQVEKLKRNRKGAMRRLAGKYLQGWRKRTMVFYRSS